MARYKLASCVFVDQSGNVVEGGICSVFLAGVTTKASIYAAETGGTAVNSVTADSVGQCTWYVDTGDYLTSQKFDVTLSNTNFTPQTYEDVVVFPEVTLDGVETLTNKTLASPLITSPTITSPLITSPIQINDTSADHQYIISVNELTADRIATLPLLTGNDDFVFGDHTQTLTNKTLTTPVVASVYQDAGKTKLMTIPNTASDTLTAIAATQTLTNKTLTTPVVASVYQDAGKTKLLTIPDTASDTLTANDATQTLTNKTLTSPTLTNPTIENTSFYNLNAGLYSRSQFEYIDANTIYIGAGQYWCKDKYCWWDAQLTSTDIGTPTASTWVYLYLDYSAITSGTEITNTELVWSEDPPAYSHASRAWLRTSTNTDDRCIMAAYSDGSQNITEFHHDENLIIFADSISATVADSTPSDTFSDITFIAPAFSTRLQVTIRGTWVDTAGNLQYRTNGQTGSTGHEIGAVQAAVAQQTTFTGDVISDSSKIIEVRWSAASAGNLIQTANIIGWYFPIGV